MSQLKTLTIGSTRTTVDELGTERRLNCRNMQLGALEFGSTEAAPLVALHGWLDNAASFIPLAKALNRPLLAIDLPGHGLSDHLTCGARYHLLDSVALISLALQLNDLDNVTLIGHSLGGCLAPFLAVALPERIRQVIMIDASGPLSESAEQLPARIQRANTEFLEPTRRFRRIYSSVDDAVDARLAVTEMLRSSAELIIRRNLEPTTGGWQWRFDPRLRQTSAQYFTEEQVHAVLAAVPCPVLWIEAARGYLTHRSETHARFSCLNHAQRVHLPGGHHLHMDDAASSAEAIEHWLENLPA